jgi:hypothetical protein
MTLRVVPGYRRIYRSNTGMVSVNIGMVPRGKEMVSKNIGMVPEREGMFSESVGMVSRVPGNIGMVPGRLE